ncbi:hypothetical protein PGTUg99_009349 [Puccinia graminis f. sp. tritici]|uniref:Uncharacterized protein n=1 Tax=Puccinia graminis f. sp. tritici TaxID=56615 RepID=A0A5B0SAJ3_PUCGR|nr:hypothetical protein PGTUg99_009349 [Puccinia graminis f. sp. tritici]
MSHVKVRNDLDLDDLLGHLPFTNVEDASQKSYLGEPERESVPFETNLTTNLAASQPPQVFNRTADNQVAQVRPSSSKASPAASAKEWEKITPTFDTVWKAALEVWSWPNAQQCIITLLREGRPLVADHLVNLQENGLLKWQCILANHSTYGANKMYLVYSDEDFTPFVAAVLKKPGSKVTIKLLMDDPARSARRKQAEQPRNVLCA